MRNQFTKYYSDAVQLQLDSGKSVEDNDVDFHLTMIKPLRIQWLTHMYNHLTTGKVKGVILKGWKKAGITGLFDGSSVRSAEDPFLSCYRV